MKLNEIKIGMRVYHCKFSPYKVNDYGIGTVIEHVSNQWQDDRIFVKKNAWDDRQPIDRNVEGLWRVKFDELKDVSKEQLVDVFGIELEERHLITMPRLINIKQDTFYNFTNSIFNKDADAEIAECKRLIKNFYMDFIRFCYYDKKYIQELLYNDVIQPIFDELDKDFEKTVNKYFLYVQPYIESSSFEIIFRRDITTRRYKILTIFKLFKNNIKKIKCYAPDALGEFETYMSQNREYCGASETHFPTIYRCYKEMKEFT